MQGRVALVTGASGGIGRAVARGLAAAGASVGLGYATGAEAAQALADELGGVAIGADMRDASAPGDLVAAVERELGPVDILVANHWLGRVQPYEEVTAEDFDEMLAVNLRAPFLLAQRVLGGMRERGWGRVLFTSSVAAFTGGIVGPHYAASKSGLHGLTHHLASRVAEAGITVNAIAPALIENTDMLPDDPGYLAHTIPGGRMGRPAEVADMAVAMLRN